MILDYIRKNSPDNNPKITKSDVMKHLKDSRMMTTHKTTVQLIKEDKIKIVRPKDKPYSDYLIINEENEFNKIYNSLAELDDFMDTIDKRFRKFPPASIDSSKLDFDRSNQRRILIENLQQIYMQVIPVFFEILLPRTNNKIRLEKDKQILYSRIIQSQQKFIMHVGEEHTIEKFDMFTSVLEDIDKKSPFKREFIEESKAVVQEFIRMLKNFKSRFSSEWPEKSG